MRRIAVLIGALLPICAGCGTGEKQFAVAPTSGVVLCNNEPVANAQVYFEPLVTGKSAVVGKQAFAFSNGEGSFQLSTYGANDGAVIGKHRVRVGGDSTVKCDCETNSEKTIVEVEIAAEKSNTFELRLPPKKAKQKKTRPLVGGAAADEADSMMDEQ